VTDTSLPPELESYLLGKANSTDPKDRMLALQKELQVWAQAELGIPPGGVSRDQVEEMKGIWRRKIAVAIHRNNAGFFYNIGDALETESYSNFQAIKDCVAHVYLGERLGGSLPRREKIKKRALELCAHMQIVMQRHRPIDDKTESEEKRRLPGQIAKLNKSINWDRIWRELGLKDPRYIEGGRGRTKGSKNVIQ
jgi:hypothetical protein